MVTSRLRQVRNPRLPYLVVARCVPPPLGPSKIVNRRQEPGKPDDGYAGPRLSLFSHLPASCALLLPRLLVHRPLPRFFISLPSFFSSMLVAEIRPGATPILTHALRHSAPPVKRGGEGERERSEESVQRIRGRWRMGHEWNFRGGEWVQEKVERKIGGALLFPRGGRELGRCFWIHHLYLPSSSLFSSAAQRCELMHHQQLGYDPP